jgi:hypothetical protein
VAATSIVLLQDEVEVVVEALSPQEIHDLGWTSHPSTGLDVVGNGELVYLSGRDATDTLTVTGYTWTLAQVPDGSAAILDSVGTEWNTFRPDVVGQYVVELTLTTTELGDVGPGSVTVTAAEWVGVGTVGGQSPDFAKGQCAACHSGNTTQWMATAHATKFERAVSGGPTFSGGTHTFYAQNCVECHTVGFDTTAVNGGFDDVQEALGWVMPDTLDPANWQDIVDNYPALATMSNIQCEN